jgi:hypothetical protein
MCRSCGQVFFVVAVVAGMLALTLGAGGQTKDTAKGKDTGKDTKAKEKIDPAKLKPDPVKVQFQKEKGEKHYKEIFEVEEAPFHESNHFLIYGKANRALLSLASDIEDAYAKYGCKALDLEPNPGPWPGKLTIFLIHDAKRYPQAVRILQRRKADEDEIGSYDMEGPVPHVTACPSKTLGEQSMEATACTQMGACLVSLKAKTRLPEWLAEGFGRATMLHAWGSNILAADRRKAAAFITRNNRNIGDVITGTGLNTQELPVLRASVADYLAYSNRTDKFLPIVSGFLTNGKNQPGDFNVGLQKANLKQEDLNKNWHNYAKQFK